MDWAFMRGIEFYFTVSHLSRQTKLFLHSREREGEMELANNFRVNKMKQM